MAKESMKAREVKRLKLVERYAAKRAALKEAGDQEGLAKLPQLQPRALAQPLQDHRSAQRLHETVRHQPYSVPRDGFQGADPGREEGELVDTLQMQIKNWDVKLTNIIRTFNA